MAQGLTRDKCLAICGISKNQFYHQPNGKKRGQKKSVYTLQKVDNEMIRRTNKEVKNYIRELFKNPRIDYGYHRMTGALQMAGFFINHKKVYRLMKEARLLQPKPIRVAKNYVRYRILCPLAPLRLMEMDIKQVWVDGQQRYAYILTIIDVFSRTVLHWSVGFQMRQDAVESAWQQIIENYLQPLNLLGWEVNIEVRSDNGPQFCAMKLRAFLKQNFLLQTFTHPYTPQENGHVESFHAILGKDLRGKFFQNLAELEQELTEFYQFYNFQRIHGSTLKLPPVIFWQQWRKGNVERIVLDQKARKVKFKLKIPRQNLVISKPAGNGNQREVLSLIFEGSMPDKIKSKTQSDGAVLNAQPAV